MLLVAAATGSNQTLAIVGLIHGVHAAGALNVAMSCSYRLVYNAAFASKLAMPFREKTHEVRTLSLENVCHFIIDDTRPGVLWGECLLQLEFGAKGTHFVHFCAAWDAAQRNMAVSSHAARAGDGFSTACDYRCVNTYALTCSNICI